VAGVAQAHGGSVTASNRAVGGAHVALTLPGSHGRSDRSHTTSALTHD
jgi:hypothetical protein